ncbi:restriction endonuclease subunit S [Helicobacter didelphidarum]|uniref:restriction endonuclease subunit S n=1 Tax=Helicobacter didelphidarum TaxID=2040648 RepID=UPI000E1F55C2|nr:restriction endonuclease subunit S [Helicobacter didelphidarum]
MSEWKTCRLGEVVDTNLKSISKNYPHKIIKYLDTGSITKNHIDEYQFYPIEKAPSRAKRLVKNGDIIYSLVRPIQKHFGFISNPDENLVVSTGFCVLTSKQDSLDSKFLYYLLSLDESIEYLDMLAESSTSAYPAIKPIDIENLEITMPSDIEEQRRIAEILSSLDDKIDLLHKQNKTLESLARLLFRHHFIDNAKSEWEEKPLSEIAEISIGRTPPRKEKE